MPASPLDKSFGGSILIRSALPSDASSIAFVHVQGWLETYSGIVPQSYLDNLSAEDRTVDWQKRLEQRGGDFFTFVAIENTEIVGFVDGGIAEQKPHGISSELAAIYLLKKAQKKNLGRRLFETFCSAIKEAGQDDMSLWVLRKNSAADFYKHMGGSLERTAKITIGGSELDEDMYTWKL
jgi:GNAT superfamily N-acetyltransferase